MFSCNTVHGANGEVCPRDSDKFPNRYAIFTGGNREPISGQILVGCTQGHRVGRSHSAFVCTAPWNFVMAVLLESTQSVMVWKPMAVYGIGSLMPLHSILCITRMSHATT
jgi:hypothetical protein